MMARGRFNTGMEINVDRAENLVVEWMKKGDFLNFYNDVERVELIERGRLITISRGKGSRKWYANHYAHPDGVIIPNIVDKKTFTSKRAVFDYCKGLRQEEEN